MLVTNLKYDEIFGPILIDQTVLSLSSAMNQTNLY